MKTKQNKWLLPALASMSVLGSTSTSQAAATISFSQVGDDVRVSANGTVAFNGSFTTYDVATPGYSQHGVITLAFRNVVGTYASGRLGIHSPTSLTPILEDFSNVSRSFGYKSIYLIFSTEDRSDGTASDHLVTWNGDDHFAVLSDTTLELLGADAADGQLAWTSNTGDTITLRSIPSVDMASLSAATLHFPLITQQHMTSVNGAHHRLLMDTPLDEEGWHTWATGDFSQFDKFDANQTIGEVGASRNFGIENFRLGLGVGHTSTDQDTMFGGGARVEGEFAVLEANYQLKDTNVILSALAYYGEYDLKTDRGYLAGGAQSKGDTDARNMAIRLRGDWKNAYTNGKFSVTPRLAYTYSESTADAYTETGGATPASFLKQESEQHEFRLGFDVDYTLSEKSSIRTIIEVVHREGDNDNLRGVAAGTIFNLPNQEVKNTWGRLGFEYVHQLNEKAVLHASAFTSTEGYDATYTGSLGIKMSF